MLKESFDLPVLFDLGATFAFALTGALAAIKRGYDIVGVLALALVTGIGGGLIRDGLFLVHGPTPLLTNPHYIEIILAAVVCGILFGARIHRFARLIVVVDALGLGAYAAFGVQKSLLAGLNPPAAVLIGLVNAVGGGVLRDLLTREEPLVFKPGQFYLLTALAGAVTFLFCSVTMELSANRSAIAAVVLTFAFRALTITLNWRTAPVASGSIFENDEAPPKR
ncbi:MAG: trimeric intracellular cation channel family protein [bacterium]|nr:trimeric intracellular cation channel family protein [bacterium]MDI1337003.1 trimeric intracellular cation channel family protein [Lacunisphaera sp.]